MAENKQIRVLRERYRKSLGDKAGILREWQLKIAGNRACDNAAENQTDMAELESWLHQLAGSAGMYNYHQIASLARNLLSELASSPAGAGQPPPIENQMLELISLLESAGKS